jgi:hypothetical protein
MTQYRFRINTNKVVEQKLSFTACVMALALQNGDIRSLCFPLAGDSDDTPRIGGGNSIPGSWLPPPDFSIHALACGRQVAGLASPGFGGDAGYVIGKKGLFCGLIWEIEAYHADDFADVAEALPELLELATDGHSEESGLWLKATLQVLIRHFISAGNLELAELVIICALERQFKDPDEAHVLLSRAESWVKDGDDESWPDELHSLPPGRHELGPGLPPLGPFDGSRPVLHWICNQIAANKPLPVGKCVLPSDGGGESGTVLGLFAVDPARHRKVFTPLNGLEYEFGTTAKGRLFARYQFAAVEERVGNRPSDEDTRKAMNLLRGGRDVPLDPKAYCVQRSVSGQAVWSQRLSRNGILVKNDGDSWTTIPLGQGEKEAFTFPS